MNGLRILWYRFFPSTLEAKAKSAAACEKLQQVFDEVRDYNQRAVKEGQKDLSTKMDALQDRRAEAGEQASG